MRDYHRASGVESINALDLNTFACMLVDADERQRAALLEEHAALVGVALAITIKDICYATWDSDPSQAAEAAAALALLAEHTGDPEIHALATWTSGIAALATGHMEHAIDNLDAAVEQFCRLDQPHTAARVQVGKLMALAMLGRYDEAVACGIAARDTLLVHGDDITAGRIEFNLGHIALRRDRYAEAEQYYLAAYAHFQSAGDPALLASVENALADVLVRQRRFAVARDLYEQALRRAAEAGLDVIQALTECNLGNLALAQGRYDQALEYLERSRRRYHDLGMPHESAYADLELAEAYLELNLIAEADAIYARVTPVFASPGMRAEQAWALAHHGQTALLLGNHAAARQRLLRARQLFETEGNEVSVALVTLFEAHLLYREGQFHAAAATAVRAEQVFFAANNRLRRLYAAWLRGEALRAAGELAEAFPILMATYQEAESGSVLQIAQRSATSLGLLASARGDRAAAEDYLERAITMIEQMRAPLPAEQFRTAFVSDKLSPFQEMVRICLDTGRIIEALHYVERARSRALVEMLGGSVVGPGVHPRDSFEAEAFSRLAALRQELNWCYQRLSRAMESEQYDHTTVVDLQATVQQHEMAILELTRQIQQRGGSPMMASSFDLASLQAALGTETVLIEYYSLDEELLAFVVTSDQVRVVRFIADEPGVAAAIDHLRFQIDALRRDAGRKTVHAPLLLKRARHYLAKIYDAVLRPLEALIDHRRLMIVPHRALHYAPFHAFFDGERHVIERYEACTVPSASVLSHCLRQRTSHRKQGVFIGVPDARAPRVRDEIEAIAPLWADRVVLLDREATLAALQQYAPQAGILHLACHGQFRPDSPLFSSVRLADGWLTTLDVYQLRLACELVVLSACETGMSTLAPGDEVIGLTRGFLAAGAPSILVSLWTVDDTTTAELMTTFYTLLRDGERPAAALRQAQRTLMERYPHPFFWAPFTLVGRW
jgi:CHAT domain-containing protein